MGITMSTRKKSVFLNNSHIEIESRYKEVAKAVVSTSPMQAFRKQLRAGEKCQATLTQLMDRADEDDFVEPKPKRFKSEPEVEVTVIDSQATDTDDSDEDEDDDNSLCRVESSVVVTYKKRFTSDDKSYRYDKSKPQPGDLVMSTAGEIGHPALTYNAIGNSYILFGIVKYFTYTKWHGPGKEAEWEGYVKNNERLKVSWMAINDDATSVRYVDSTEPSPRLPKEDPTLIFSVDIPPVHKESLKLISKCNCSDLSMISEFARKEINEKFRFYTPEGWKHSTGMTVPVQKKRRSAD